MQNLIRDEAKHLEFPYEEFHKYFKNYPAGVLKQLIVDNAIACYCYHLACSLFEKHIVPSFSNPYLQIVYSFKDFEIQHLKLLNNTNQYNILNSKLNIKKVDNFCIAGDITFNATPVFKENLKELKLIIELNLNLKKVSIPKYKSDILKFFNVLYNSFSQTLIESKKHSEYSIKPKLTFNKTLKKIYYPVLRLTEHPFDYDVLACIFSLWLYNNSKDFMLFCVDDILYLRGIKKLCMKELRSGYKNSKREKIKQEILKQNITLEFENFIWADDEDKKRASNLFWAGDARLFNINTWGFKNDYYFVLQPTEFMKELIKKRSYFSINSAILNLHSRRYSQEKKLAYYLMEKLKNKSVIELKVGNLINFLYKNKKLAKPSILRDRVEEMLDKLNDKNIIKFWHYKRIDEKLFAKKSWLLKWFNLKIIVAKN